MTRSNLVTALALGAASFALVHASDASADDAAVEPIRAIFHVGSSDKSTMKTALWNVRNFIEYFEAQGRPAEAKIVVNGPGVQMLRTDQSPVIDMLEIMDLELPNVEYVACGISVEYFAEREGAPPPLFAPTQITHSGVAYIAQLQSEGWSYIKP